MKIRLFLIVWFLLLFAVSAVLLSPLHLWRDYINQALADEGVRIETFEGRLWQGKASLRVDQLRGDIQLQWKMKQIFEPIDFQLGHKSVNAWGSFQFDLDEVSLWLDQLSLSSELLNSYLEPYQAKVTGGHIVLDKLYGKWPYVESMPDKLRGNGYWDGGQLDYRLARRQSSLDLEKVLFELVNINQVNQLKVMSIEGVSFVNLHVNQSGEMELSVMPAAFDLINQPWSGDKDTPAFVMTDKLF